MKMINNYLSSLATYLPEEMRQEVKDELEASILGQVEDKQEVLGRELELEEVETILKNLGHPMLVASAYLPNQQLISKDYFPAYKKALEIAIVAVLSINFLLRIPAIFTSESIIGSAISTAFHLFEIALWVFAIVTLVFFLMEKHGTNLKEIYAWSPKDIRDSHPKLSIKRLDSFFEAAISVFFLAWWNNLVDWPAFPIQQELTAPMSLSDEWQSAFWSVNIIIALSIGVHIINIIIAGWNRFTLSLNITLGFASLVVIYQIMQFDQFVVISDLSNTANLSIEILNQVIFAILAGVAAFCLWDIYGSFTKLTRRDSISGELRKK